jgi:hypothetical protein
VAWDMVTRSTLLCRYTCKSDDRRYLILVRGSVDKAAQNNHRVQVWKFVESLFITALLLLCCQIEDLMMSLYTIQYTIKQLYYSLNHNCTTARPTFNLYLINISQMLAIWDMIFITSVNRTVFEVGDSYMGTMGIKLSRLLTIISKRKEVKINKFRKVKFSSENNPWLQNVVPIYIIHAQAFLRLKLFLLHFASSFPNK